MTGPMTRRLLVALMLLAVSPAARAEVAVTYPPARGVSTFLFRSASEREAIYRALADLLTSLGRKNLPKGRTLSVELLDVRPAGRFRPIGVPELRILTDATPPSVKLRYTLKDRGRLLAGGEETVTDLNYLSNISARTSLASFPYESELMRDWFRDRIVRLRPQLR